MAGSLGRQARAALELAREALRTPAVARSLPAVEGSFPVAVWFSESPATAYQLTQWLAPLEALAAAGTPVVLLLTRAGTVARIRPVTSLPVLLVRGSAELDRVLLGHHVEVICYVNNARDNFTVLRTTGVRHVHLNHGESEKVSMVSHQLQAYDFCLVAGAAAIRRITSVLPRIRPEALIPIGRPQLDAIVRVEHDPTRTTVLYAPTWEGDRPEMAYGSMHSHGPAIARALLGRDDLTLVVRPHPLTGSRIPEQRTALAETRSLLTTAGAPHRWDDRPAPDAALAEADLVITDVSAMALDAVALGIPVLITRPVDPRAWLDPAGSAGRLPLLAAEDLAGLDERVLAAAAAGPGSQQQSLAEDHVGDRAPGAASIRFREAIEAIRRSPVGGSGPAAS